MVEFVVISIILLDLRKKGGMTDFFDQLWSLIQYIIK